MTCSKQVWTDGSVVPRPAVIPDIERFFGSRSFDPSFTVLPRHKPFAFALSRILRQIQRPVCTQCGTIVQSDRIVIPGILMG